MIQPLTSLRFVFAMLIFMHHFRVEGKELFPEGGVLAVCFFFILSGFMLAYNYKERFIAKQISVRTFYIARLTKLYPLHFFCFIVSFILLFKVLSLKYLWIIPLNLSLIQSWIPIREVYFSYNAVSWFSSNMLFFYLVFPCLIIYLHKLSCPTFLTIIGWIVLIYFIAIAIIPAQWQHPLFYINPGFRLIDFCFGIFLFYLIDMIKISEWECSYKKYYATFFELIAIGLLILAVFLAPQIPQVYRWASYYWIPVISIIFVFVYFNNWGGYFSRILSIRPLIYLGNISFSFYMIHQLIIVISNWGESKFGIGWPWQLKFIIVLILTIALSVISFCYIEKKAGNWLKLKLKK